MAIAYIVKRRYADAERVIRRGLALEPDVGVLWFNLTDVLVFQGRFAVADSALQELGRKFPEMRNRLQLAVRVAYAQGDYAKGLVMADSLSRSDQPGFQVTSRGMKANAWIATGRLAAAEREIKAAMDQNLRRGAQPAYLIGAIQLASIDLLVRDRPEAARHTMDSVLAGAPIDSLPVANRPYLELASFYARAGDPDRAERYYQTWERETPPVVRNGETRRYSTQGLIALARGRATDALAPFRKAREVEGCNICWLAEIGETFDALQLPDSARATYESLVTLPEPGTGGRQFNLVPALRRLGELAEARGDKTEAVKHYTRLLDLWREADPDLTPRVTKVKQRIAELVGEPKTE